MPVDSQGKHIYKKDKWRDKQKSQADYLRKKKSPTGSAPIGVGPSGAAVGGGS